MRSTVSRYQREKGKRVERAAAHAWTRVTGAAAHRSQQFCGKDGDGDIKAQEGIHFEVKARKKIACVRFMEQAKSDAKNGDVPIVIMKEDRGPFLVLCELDDLQKLVELLGDSVRENRVREED